MDCEYPECELALKQNIDDLMRDWCTIADNKGAFTSDGFYPYYTQQKRKILFIGRESRNLFGQDYIQSLHCAYKSNAIGGRSVGQNAFHRRILRLCYGLLNGFLDFENLPSAKRVIQSFALDGGVSFAFMNISKSSNASNSWSSNWEAIKSSIKAAIEGDENYIKKEIGYLAPEIIITGNLRCFFSEMFDGFEQFENISKENDWVDVFWVYLQDRKILLIDTYHFSLFQKLNGRKVTDKESFYNPIAHVVKRYLS